MQDKNLIKQYAAQNGLKSRRQYQNDDRYYDDGYNDDYNDNDEYGYEDSGHCDRKKDDDDDYYAEEYTPAHFKQKETGDPFTSITLTQTAVCIAALLAVFIVKFIGGNIYTGVKTGYINRFCRETSAENVVATITSITKNDNGNGSSDQTEQNTSSLAENENASSDEVSSDDNSDSLQNGDAYGNPKGESTPAADEKSAAEAPAIGAEDDLPDKTQSTAPTAKPLASAKSQNGAKAFNIGSRISPVTATIPAAAANSLLTPISGEITSLYGLRDHPIYNENLFHSGIDISADYGSEIKSALDGTVKTVASDSGYGIYTVIQSGNITALYAHCSKINVAEGDTVKRGQNIAEVGSTGVSTGPHLHFEVSVNGVTVNPLWLLSNE